MPFFLLLALGAVGGWLWYKRDTETGLLDAPEAFGEVVTAYENGQPFQISVTPIGGGYVLRSDVAKSYFRMRDAAGTDGVTLLINSAFRSMAKQTALYGTLGAYNAGGLAARPGYSPHQSGKAVDIETAGGTNASYNWLQKNAWLYGFRNPRPALAFLQYEPWHYQFDGGATPSV